MKPNALRSPRFWPSTQAASQILRDRADFFARCSERAALARKQIAPFMSRYESRAA